MMRKVPVDKELIVSHVIQSQRKVLTGMLFYAMQIFISIQMPIMTIVKLTIFHDTNYWYYYGDWKNILILDN